jgi:hypothetical protein
MCTDPRWGSKTFHEIDAATTLSVGAGNEDEGFPLGLEEVRQSRGQFSVQVEE